MFLNPLCTLESSEVLSKNMGILTTDQLHPDSLKVGPLATVTF